MCVPGSRRGFTFCSFHAPHRSDREDALDPWFCLLRLYASTPLRFHASTLLRTPLPPYPRLSLPSSLVLPSTTHYTPPDASKCSRSANVRDVCDFPAPCPTSNVMLYRFASDVFLSYVTLLTHLIRIPVSSMITVLLAHMCTRSPCSAPPIF